MWITKWEIQFFSGKAHNWILLLYLLFCVNNRHSVAIKCLNKCKWSEHQKHHHFYRYTPDTHLLTPTHLIAQLNAVGLEWQGPPRNNCQALLAIVSQIKSSAFFLSPKVGIAAQPQFTFLTPKLPWKLIKKCIQNYKQNTQESRMKATSLKKGEWYFKHKGSLFLKFLWHWF